MSRGEKRQDAACVAQRPLRGLGRRAIVVPKLALPDLWRGVWIEEQASPDAVREGVFRKIAIGRPQGQVGIAVAAAGQTRAFAPFEGKRVKDLASAAAAEAESATVSRREHRVAPEQHALGARPDAMDDSVPAI